VRRHGGKSARSVQFNSRVLPDVNAEDGDVGCCQFGAVRFVRVVQLTKEGVLVGGGDDLEDLGLGVVALALSAHASLAACNFHSQASPSPSPGFRQSWC
jgi:hypothetical protein